MQKKSINCRYKYKKYNKTANLNAGKCDKTADINEKNVIKMQISMQEML